MTIHRYDIPIEAEEDDMFDFLRSETIDVNDLRLTEVMQDDNTNADAYAPYLLWVTESHGEVRIRIENLSPLAVF